MEHHGYLTGGSAPLYVICHEPSGAPCGNLILVPPFAEEQKAARRALVEAARAFCTDGWLVWRPDLGGTGDSFGDHGSQTLGGWTTDLKLVSEAAARTLPSAPLAWAGLRLGAALAWRASRLHGGDLLLLWEPIINGSTYLRQCRQRSQIRRQLTSGEDAGVAPSDTAWDFDGYAIGSKLQQELESLDLMSEPVPPSARVQMLQISGSPRLRPAFTALRDRWDDSIADLSAVVCEPFWSSIGLVNPGAVIQSTAAWLAASASLPAPLEPHPLPMQPEVVFDGLRATAVTIASPRRHLATSGVLYRPASGDIETAMVVLHGWSGYRSGPARLSIATARHAAGQGMAALACDFCGRGDSEGEVADTSLVTMIEDAGSWVSWLNQQFSVAPVTLLGLCSGSEVALGCSTSRPAVRSLVLWSAPVFAGTFTAARQARRGRAALQSYARKLWRRESWEKVLSGRLNLKMILRAVTGQRSSEDAAVKDTVPTTTDQMTRFSSFQGRVLLIYGGADPETSPSRDFYRSFLQAHGIAHRFEELEGANHNFYSAQWHRQLWAATWNWLGSRD